MKLAKNISFFTFFNLLNAAIPFLLLPVLTVYLSKADYGIIDIFNSLNMLFTPLVALSVVNSISRFYFEESIRLPVFVKTIFRATVKYGIIFVLLSILISGVLLFVIKTELAFPPVLLVISALFVFFSQISEVLLTLWRVSFKTVYYGIFRVSKTFIDVALSIYLVVSLGYGWIGRIGPQIFVMIIFGFVAIYYLKKIGYIGKKLEYDHTYLRRALSYSLPLIFHSIGGYVIAVSDRFFVLFIEGAESTGIYAVAYQIGMVIGLFQNSFNQAWVPFFFESLNKGSYKTKRKIVFITYLYGFGMILMILIISALTPLFYDYFIGREFRSGASIVFWVLLGYAFNGMYKMIVNYLFYLKKTKVVAKLTIGVALVNMILNYYLILENGILGAAQATAISFLLLFIIILIKVLKVYKMPWNLRVGE
ncbi:oligosaccharide flippase family protein [Flagellimonas halotolerans]|uniref:Oligosaccharide flippase family protein n=1 Tax=Flagellimonas halotolerans TaxID=3112164 RepID=A0ABU6IL96_9FLAO|nr:MULTISPECIES: oligosaccharide flippase family protein [unclassified Allomuricauda]MEC3963973.1 oligosaccharide flippase family protein [Muricauda sp. SYSU M86414]MEC4263843.1 oligosaccharide flippase family protein [Muricauda sp. SYSU M84420]